MVISQIRHRRAFYFIFLIKDRLSVSKSEYPDSRVLLKHHILPFVSKTDV